MSRSRRTVLIINRRALRLSEEDSPLLARYRREVARGVIVRETESEDDLRDAIASFAPGSDDVVLFAGGDGTVRAGVTALSSGCEPGTLPTVAFLPGGTVGTIASRFGYVAHRLPTDLCESIRRAHTRIVPTVRVEADSGAPLIGFIVGAGLVARFFSHYYADRDRRSLGRQAAVRLIARIFAGSFVKGALAEDVLTPVPAHLVIDGVAARHDRWSLLIASVLPDLGLHLRVTYRGGADERRPIHLVASPEGARVLGPQLFHVLRGEPLPAPAVDETPAHVQIAFREPNAFVVDGDVFTAKRVVLTNGPSFRVLSP